jgi:hypothetical protein
MTYRFEYALRGDNGSFLNILTTVFHSRLVSALLCALTHFWRSRKGRSAWG